MTEFDNASDFELRIFKKYAYRIGLSIPRKRGANKINLRSFGLNT